MMELKSGPHPPTTIESEDHLKAALFEAAPDAIVSVDPCGTIVMVNAQVIQMFGYERDVVLGADLDLLIPQEFRHNELRGALRHDPSISMMDVGLSLSGRHRDGTMFPIEVSLASDQRGLESQVIVAIRQVTTLRQIDRDARDSSDSVVILYQLNPPDYLYVSPNCSNLLGLEDHELPAKGDWQMVHAEDKARVDCEYRTAIARGRSAMAEYRVVRPDGQLRLIRSTATPVPNPDGPPERMVITLEDIGDRMNETAALNEAEASSRAANEAKNQFLSRMSHELRTPLNAVLGFAQLLEMELAGDDRIQSVRQILKSGRCLLDLINDDFDIARIEAGETSLSVEPVPLAGLIDEAMQVMAPLAESSGITLLQTLSPSDCLVLADRHRLRQILLNLLSNAVKYNHPGGRVWVARRILENEVQITIHDDGPGIPVDLHDRLFTPLDRLGAEAGTIEGKGIGLALTRSLTTLMSGSLTVDSVVGRGSAFTITLPRSQAPDAANGAAVGDGATEAGVPPGTYTLLYIEDNEPNVLVVERVLKLRPAWKLIHAALGSLGIELAQAHQPQMILLDLHLPDGSGVDVLEVLKADEATRNLSVVVLTADVTSGNKERVLALGATSCLTKPLDVSDLVELLDHFGDGGLTDTGR